MNPIVFQGRRSRSQWTNVEKPCEHDREKIIKCIYIKLNTHITHDERMNPIDFQGQKSKVKVKMDKYGNNLVNKIETKPLCVFSSSLIHILLMMRG